MRIHAAPDSDLQHFILLFGNGNLQYQIFLRYVHSSIIRSCYLNKKIIPNFLKHNVLLNLLKIYLGRSSCLELGLRFSFSDLSIQYTVLGESLDCLEPSG
jgi:hypothetical protein